MEFFSVQEFADKIGVHANTLRRWEKEGKLLPHHKTVGGHRVYSQEQVDNYLRVFNKGVN